MIESQTGVLLISGSQSNGKISEQPDFNGKSFHCIANSSHSNSLVVGVLVACEDGLYSVNESTELISSLSFKKIASGKDFMVGIDKSGQLFSWGQGIHGELGLGLKKTQVEEPTKLNFGAAMIDISCGEAFSMAIDKKGNLYGWGENFERQLGLYTKPKSAMAILNALVEDVLFQPRLIPLSLTFPIQKVSCGARFVIALAKNGEVFSWGAGECGQLGTGRCTFKEVPSAVSIGSNQGVQVTDIACGNSHVLVVSSTCQMYGWGLNKSGQLGINKTSTQYTPVCVQSSNKSLQSLRIYKVFAEGHSSAAIDLEGELYTWGSELQKRLMHNSLHELFNAQQILQINPNVPPEEQLPPKVYSYTPFPIKVEGKQLEGLKIQSFALSKYCSAMMVLTTLQRVEPSQGPKRNFSKLLLHGSGFWNAPKIVVKFSPKSNSPYVKPHSSVGKLFAPGVISCKPPKFSEMGFYVVSLSMDGNSFLPQSCEIFIYREITLLKQSPELVDIRTKDPVAIHLTVKGIGNKSLEDNSNDNSKTCWVKLVFYRNPLNSSEGIGYSSSHKGLHPNNSGAGIMTKQSSYPSLYHPNNIAFEIVEMGSIKEVRNVPIPIPHHDDGAADVLGVQVVEPIATETEADILCDNINLSALVAASQMSRTLYEMKALVSLNGQDFSQINLDPTNSTAFHTCSLLSCEPSCLNAPPLSSWNSNPSTANLSNMASNSSLSGAVNDNASVASGNASISSRAQNNKSVSQSQKNIALEDRVIRIRGESFLPANKIPSGYIMEAQLSIPEEIVIPAQLAENLSVQNNANSRPNSRDNKTINSTRPSFVANKGGAAAPNRTSVSRTSSLGRKSLTNNNALTGDNNGLIPTSLTLPVNFESTESATISIRNSDLRLISSMMNRYLKTSLDSSIPFNMQIVLKEIELLSDDPNADHEDDIEYKKKDRDTKKSYHNLVLSDGWIPFYVYRDQLVTVSPNACRDFPLDSPPSGSKAIVTMMLAPSKEFEFLSNEVAVALMLPNPHGSGTKTPSNSQMIIIRDGVRMVPATELLPDEGGVMPEQASIQTSSGILDAPTPEQQPSGVMSSRPSEYHFTSNKSGYKIIVEINLPISKQFPNFPSDFGNLDYVSMAVLLDGHTLPNEECWTKFYLYSNLGLYSLQTAIPKGGFTSGTTIVLALEQYVPLKSIGEDQCFIRIRGKDETQFIEIQASLLEGSSNNSSQVSFMVPESNKIQSIEPVLNGKDKMYYVDVSVDGGLLYDKSSTAMIQCK